MDEESETHEETYFIKDRGVKLISDPVWTNNCLSANGRLWYQWLSLRTDSRELFKGISIRNVVDANKINGTI